MRDRLVFPAVILAALGLSALVLLPRLGSRPERSVPPIPPGPPPEPVAVSAAATASAAAPTLLPAYVRRDPASATACPAGMLLVEGVYCPFVGHRCTEFIDEGKDICRAYAPEVLCEGRLERRRFCIDEFEYPNLEGVYPVVMTDYGDALRACEVEGKRLCSTEEWQFACEGPQMWAYPYGLTRDPTACNIDRPHPDPALAAFSDPWKVGDEVDRLDRRVRSGELTRCVSPFGVRDMTGNVDEWTTHRAGKRDEKPYRSALKGGYWGPIRARCRPMTSSHNEWFSFYQVGFRCCSETRDRAPAGAVPQRNPRTSVPRRGGGLEPQAAPTRK